MDGTITEETAEAAMVEALKGVSTLLHYAAQANGQAGSFTREIRRQSSGVEASLAATRDSVGRDTAARTAGDLRNTLVGAVADALQVVTSEMQRIADRIDAKASEAGRLVAMIDQIGATIRQLSLNATIEAARAGAEGRGFAVVAMEVRDLANRTRESARTAATVIDFSDVRAELDGLRRSTDQALDDLGGVVRATSDRIEALLGTVGGELAAISASNASINEALAAMQGCLDRTEAKTTRAEALVGDVATAVSGGPAPDPVRYGLARLPASYDRLDDVLARGRLRIAVEPDFKGLSFRRSPGGPLVGLDIDYATAFSRYLGVEAQFVECPWDQCTELLALGRGPGDPPVDIVWSALPPSAAFRGVAYSRAYTYLPCVLARRAGDTRIRSLADLEGRTLGIINDPSAYATLEAAGLRWAQNLHAAGPRLATLGSLIAMTDQGRIHDALAGGAVDAFAVDAPIMHWACTHPDSPWSGRIEILPGNIAAAPWYYAVATADHPSACRLLMTADAFIAGFVNTRERAEIERTWQGAIIAGTHGYRDEPGGLRGASELAVAYRAVTGRDPVLPNDFAGRRVA